MQALYRDLSFIYALKCYHLNKSFNKVLILSTHPIINISDDIDVQIINKQIFIKNLPEDIYIKKHQSSVYSIERNDPNSLCIRISNDFLQNSSIYYYSNGNIHLIDMDYSESEKYLTN